MRARRRDESFSARRGAPVADQIDRRCETFVSQIFRLDKKSDPFPLLVTDLKSPKTGSLSEWLNEYGRSCCGRVDRPPDQPGRSKVCRGFPWPRLGLNKALTAPNKSTDRSTCRNSAFRHAINLNRRSQYLRSLYPWLLYPRSRAESRTARRVPGPMIPSMAPE